MLVNLYSFGILFFLMNLFFFFGLSIELEGEKVFIGFFFFSSREVLVEVLEEDFG